MIGAERLKAVPGSSQTRPACYQALTSEGVRAWSLGLASLGLGFTTASILPESSKPEYPNRPN